MNTFSTTYRHNRTLEFYYCCKIIHVSVLGIEHHGMKNEDGGVEGLAKGIVTSALRNESKRSAYKQKNNEAV